MIPGSAVIFVSRVLWQYSSTVTAVKTAALAMSKGSFPSHRNRSSTKTVTMRPPWVI